MPPPLASVGPGDTPPNDREAWNAIIQSGRNALVPLQGADAPISPATTFAPQVTVFVVNATAAALPAFSVVGISTAQIDPAAAPHDARQTPVFLGVTPSSGAPFGILIEPAAVGAIARCAILGVVPVPIRINADTDTFAGPSGGSTGELLSAETGPAAILSPTAGGAAPGSVVSGLVLLQWYSGVSAPEVMGSGSGDTVPPPDDDGYPNQNAPPPEEPYSEADVKAVRDTRCVEGTLYVTRGRLQIVSSGGTLKLDWYDLVATAEG